MPERGKTGKSNRQHVLHTARTGRWQAKPVQAGNTALPLTFGFVFRRHAAGRLE
jgi:hypothetical protein